MKDYVTTQLLNIAEAIHKFKERILDFLIEDLACLTYLVNLVLTG